MFGHKNYILSFILPPTKTSILLSTAVRCYSAVYWHSSSISSEGLQCSHNCMESFTNLRLSAFIREKACIFIRFSKGVCNSHKKQSSLISSGGNADWVGLPWYQLSNFSRCTCIFRKWFKWTEQASVQTVQLIPFHNIGFTSLKLKVLAH